MEKLPRHIAIIMDGNGRWAQKRGHNRIFGHVRGAEQVRKVTRECAKIGIESLTLYAFSTENWQRPSLEVNLLMKLLLRYLKNETQELIDNNLRFRAVGFTDMLPANVQAELKRMTEATAKNTGMYFNLAVSYGSRQELVHAVKKIAQDAASGQLKTEEINEDLISSKLFTSESADPDLLIRTGGDQRVSNFLLWQIAYAELYFMEKCWPDFTIEDLHVAIATFMQRERRFGHVSAPDHLIGAIPQ